jgi:hypothetical protein
MDYSAELLLAPWVNQPRGWSQNDPDGPCARDAERRSLSGVGVLASAATEVNAVPEYVDLRVHDRVALDEIDLYAEVLGAVAASDGPLSNEELDEVLGVRPAHKVLGRIA